MLLALALVRLLAAASCSTTSTLGKKEMPCMETSNTFEVHYGYSASADTASFCAINTKYADGFVYFGPATSVNDDKGVVVAADTVRGSTRQKAWKIASLRTSREEVKDFFTGTPLGEVNGTKHRVCFSVRTAKLRGSVKDAKFQWFTGQLKELGSHKRTSRGSRMSLDLEKAMSDGEAAPGKEPLSMRKLTGEEKEIKCATSSSLGKEHLPCMTVARGIEVHFGLKGGDVSLCAVNTGNEDGWLGLGPGIAMKNSTVVIGEGPSGKLKHKPVKLKSWDVVKDKPDDLVIGDIEHSILEGKRMICYTMKVANLNGNSSEAKFIWAFGDKPALSEHKYSNSGMMTIDFMSGKVSSVNNSVPVVVALHVVCMALAFLVFFPAGVIIAVYSGPSFAKGEIYFTVHRVMMFVGLVIAMIGFVLIALHANIFSGIANAHGILGLLSLCCCIGQPINGAFRVVKDHPNRRIWEYLHKGLGRVTVLGGLYSCILGAVLYRDKGFASEGTGLFLLILVIIIASAALCTWLVMRLRQKRVMHSQAVIAPSFESVAEKADGKIKSPKTKMPKQSKNANTAKVNGTATAKEKGSDEDVKKTKRKAKEKTKETVKDNAKGREKTDDKTNKDNDRRQGED